MHEGRILVAERPEAIELKLEGTVRYPGCLALHPLLERVAADPHSPPVTVDLTATQMLDSTALGELAFLARARRGRPVRVIVAENDAHHLLRSVGLDRVLELVAGPPLSAEDMAELDQSLGADATSGKEGILRAHRTLAELNAHNRERFRELIELLESGGDDG